METPKTHFPWGKGTSSHLLSAEAESFGAYQSQLGRVAASVQRPASPVPPGACPACGVVHAEPLKDYGEA